MMGLVCNTGEKAPDLTFEINNRFSGNTPKETEDTKHHVLIAEALNSLSLEDREKVIHEMHGVAPFIEETPELIAERREELRLKLAELKGNADLLCAGINLAESINPEYVYDDKLLLKFLRSELFEAERAANRMIKYFHWKLRLFGKDALCREITVKDLNPEELKLLKKGYMQVLPARDSAGRAVWFAYSSGGLFRTGISLARLYFYMSKTDEETDKLGVVVMCFKYGSLNLKTDLTPDFIEAYKFTLEALPYRFSVYHKCLLSSRSSMAKLLDKVIGAATSDKRVRYKIHYGSYTEWMYSLMSYGIRANLIPITADGKIKLKNHIEFLEMRKAGEEYAMTNQLVKTYELPLSSDVLLGRGKPIQEHTGNLRLQAIVDELVDRYQTLSKSEKTALAADVVKMAKTASARFLTKESGIWIEVSDEIARDKVSHLFRSRRKSKPKNSSSERAIDKRMGSSAAIRDCNNAYKRVKV